MTMRSDLLHLTPEERAKLDALLAGAPEEPSFVEWMTDDELRQFAAIRDAAFDRAGVPRRHCNLLGADPRCACRGERVMAFRDEWLSDDDRRRLEELRSVVRQRQEAGVRPWSGAGGER
jgi:hypothetical protein